MKSRKKNWKKVSTTEKAHSTYLRTLFTILIKNKCSTLHLYHFSLLQTREVAVVEHTKTVMEKLLKKEKEN